MPRILVADDDADARERIAAILQKESVLSVVFESQPFPMTHTTLQTLSPCSCFHPLRPAGAAAERAL